MPFEIKVITEKKKLIDLEINRCLFYLSKYSEYKEKGYSHILRFPEGTTPENYRSFNDSEFSQIISDEVNVNFHMYLNFENHFAEAIRELKKCILVKQLPQLHSVIFKYLKITFMPNR